jgi:O-antigen/teichoic acid export membrane protein
VTSAHPVKALRFREQGFAWGLVDQGFSSATTFGLTVLVGRALGPAGLAAVFIGFTLYLIALTFQRSLITDPLVARSSTLGEEARALAGRAALAVVVLWAVSATVVTFAAAVLVGGRFGHGMLVVAPWLLAALLQDFWRAVLFRDGRARAAAANDGLWLAAMAISAPFAWGIGGAWAIVGCWGAGALAGGLAGLVQTGYRPLCVRAAIQWWRHDAWLLGRWLGLESVAYNLTTYGTVLLLVAFLGATAYGGLRAIQSVFAPLSLLVPALTLPGLPAVARSLATSSDAARSLAIQISGLVTGLTILYVSLFTLSAGLLTAVFGERFARFQVIVLPIGLAQIALATAAGFPLLLKVQGRGRALFLSRLTALVLMLTASTALAVTRGLTAVAWGMFAAAVIASGVLAVVTLRPNHEHTSRLSRPAEQV